MNIQEGQGSPEIQCTAEVSKLCHDQPYAEVSIGYHAQSYTEELWRSSRAGEPAFLSWICQIEREIPTTRKVFVSIFPMLRNKGLNMGRVMNSENLTIG
jgi:hypothetical protein